MAAITTMPACLPACLSAGLAPSPAEAGGPRRWMKKGFSGSPSLSLAVCTGQPGPTNCTVPDYPPACLVVHEAAETRRGPAIVARASEGLKTRALRSRSPSRSQVKERRSFHKLLGQKPSTQGRSDKKAQQPTHNAGQQHAAGAILGLHPLSVTSGARAGDMAPGSERAKQMCCEVLLVLLSSRPRPRPRPHHSQSALVPSGENAQRINHRPNVQTHRRHPLSPSTPALLFPPTAIAPTAIAPTAIAIAIAISNPST
ncbi:hypothetical protein COCVIDRAFT_20030 [Bipolaris victoriae FI3]|uniref:Ig-like domain-containing protein n=1 Tax=Bipolaris victoriae (strain FI3) TaxID=930091 RepID=W7EDD9_BIPV3|nr:hypothetical protein COCVIDRAFT_20030 [Bipolaris victoriae FI3]